MDVSACAGIPLPEISPAVMAVFVTHLQMSPCGLNLLSGVLDGLGFDSLFLYLQFLPSVAVASTGCHQPWLLVESLTVACTC